jgi:hypothetical protein
MSHFKIFAFGILLSIAHQTFCQELKDKSVCITYDEFPKLVFPSYVNTYSLKFKGDVATEGLVMNIANQEFILKGLKKADNKTADITVVLQAGICKVQNKRVAEIMVKDPSGAVRKQYQNVYTFTWPLEINIVLNKTKDVLDQRIIHTNETSEEVSESMLDKNYLSNIYLKESPEKACIRGTLVKIIDQINAEIAKTSKYNCYPVYLAKGKKLNYDDLDLAYKNCKDGYKLNVKNSIDSASMRNFKAATNVWEKALTEADTNNIGARINKPVFYGINYNLALAYFGMKDFDNAWKHLNIASKLNVKEFNEGIKKLSDLISGFESGYYLSNPDAKLSNSFYGKWKLTGLLCDEKFDLNKDGKSSFDILSEYNDCKKDQIFEFGHEKSLIISTGKNSKDCSSPKESKLYWKIMQNKTTERKYLLWDNSIDIDADMSTITEITYLSHHALIVKGYVHIGGDTSSGCTFTFKKIQD